MQEIDTDVLVVGSGPAGVMLAYELALAGVGVTVIDRLAERPVRSREVGIPVRTVEILEQRGLLADVEQAAIAQLPDSHFGQLPVMLGYDGWQSRHPYALALPHQKLVEILETALAERFDVPVRRSHELTGLEQDQDGVTVTVQTPNGEKSLRARYVVGCDGSRSQVRELAGIGFPGTEAKIGSIVATVRVAAPSESVGEKWNSVEQLFHQKRSGEVLAVLIPQAGGTHQLAGADWSKPPVSTDTPVTMEEINDLLQRGFTEPVEIAEVVWSSRFTDETRQVEQYRDRRILLAGDAAHVNFPANGQGMHLGVLDAVNLGWKLAAEIRGWAPESLLDSYHAEQHLAGERVLENTKAQAEVTFPNPHNEALRRTITTMLKVPEVHHYLGGLLSGLDVRYPTDGPEHALLGARMVDVELSTADGDRWFSELLHDGRGALVTADPQYAEVAKPWLDRISVTEVPELPDVAATAVLVRPDGYVCWVAAAGDAEDDPQRWLRVALNHWFGA